MIIGVYDKQDADLGLLELFDIPKPHIVDPHSLLIIWAFDECYVTVGILQNTLLGPKLKTHTLEGL